MCQHVDINREENILALYMYVYIYNALYMYILFLQRACIHACIHTYIHFGMIAFVYADRGAVIDVAREQEGKV